MSTQARLSIVISLSGTRYRLCALVFLLTASLGGMAAAEPQDFEGYLANAKFTVIQSQKLLDAGEYDRALALLNLGIARYPQRDDLYALKGECLYKSNRLDEAEATLRQALRLNPLNEVAKRYIEEIRTTEEAQVSTEWQEWMSVFRDKVGDFIVTFLAFATAFLVGSAIEPLKLRWRVHTTQRLFIEGDYDEFLDTAETLLDEEQFAPLRSTFRFLLRQKSFEEAKQLLSRHVNTPERLPTLLRILEREHEKYEQQEADDAE